MPSRLSNLPSDHLYGSNTLYMRYMYRIFHFVAIKLECVSGNK